MKTADQATADAFTDYMLHRFGGVLVPQEVISTVLSSVLSGFDPTQIINVVSPAIAITIGPFVYRKAGLSPDDQMVVAVHECAHLEQQRKYGILKDWGLYIAQPEARAQLECQGYHAGLEFWYARTRQLPSLDDLVSPLQHGYLLGGQHVGMCRQLLDSEATSVAAGVLSTPSGIAGVEWVRNNAIELLAT